MWSFFIRKPLKTNNGFTKLGLYFHSPFGTAGGLDKEAKDLMTWTKWRAGFLEIGTFTPLPQTPNPGKIIDRNTKEQALWNCMGFPNAGFEAVLPRIKAYKSSFPESHPPLFINIGKNRQTPLNLAQEDYVKGVLFFKDVADAFVINISSPNTTGLRLLHQKDNFQNFIKPILDSAKSLDRRIPVLVKVSPDLDDASFVQFLTDSVPLDIDGFILTNTSVDRPKEVEFPERGGLSGAPLAKKSIHKLKLARKTLGKDSNKILVSVGGVCSPQEAVARLSSGADLVQAYSGLIFYGPSLFKDAAKKLYF